MRIIKLETHNENWSRDFEKEAAAITGVLSGNLIATYHIGSTAISGIKAKPVIDVILEVRSIDEIDQHLKEFEELGYEARGEHGINGRRFFQRGGNERTHHVHVFESGNPEIERHRLFVEYMNSNRDRALEYEELKMNLLNNYKEEPEKYSKGKSVFIRNINAEAINWKYG